MRWIRLALICHVLFAVSLAAAEDPPVRVPLTVDACVRKAVEYNLGIRVHYFARVSFDGFSQIVDALGGVDIPYKNDKYIPPPHERDLREVID